MYSLINKADTKNQGKIEIQDAVNLFKKSGLPNNILK